MKSNQTFSILIWANKAKQDIKGLLPLYARITIDGQRAEISLKRKVESSKWHAQSGFLKGNSSEVRLVNQYIGQLQNQLFSLYQQLLINHETITAQALKERFLGVQQRKMLLEIFDYHNAQIEKLIGIDIVRATYAKFKTVRKKLADFISYQYGKQDYYLDELSHVFIADFEFYFKTKAGIDHNTAMRYIRNIKKIVHMAVKNGWLTSNPLINFKCSLRKVDRDVLTKEELVILWQKEFDIKRLEEVRNVFLFCCYTGYSFIDTQKLTTANIVVGIDVQKWIYTSRQKTKIKSNVPLLPHALTIIDKYVTHPGCIHKNLLLPVKSNQKMNAYLKEIADICGLQKKLTMHIARHTFATTVTLANGVPIETVSTMLGHTSLKPLKFMLR